MERGFDDVPIFEDEGDAQAVLENPDLSREERLAAEAALEAMREGWDAETLAALPVLHQGQADDCHVEDQSGYRRIWLSRTGVADGEPFENTVSIEGRRDGSWVTVAKYDGGELADEDEGGEDVLDGTFTLRIELGNAAMCRVEDVAEAVRRLAERLESGDESGNVYDVNGNTVGSFEFEAS